MYIEEKIKLQFDAQSDTLMLGYEPLTDRTIYDICDRLGTVVKTGTISSADTQIDLQDVSNNEYYVLVLDGDRVWTARLTLQR